VTILALLLACGDPEPDAPEPGPAVLFNELMAYNVSGELDEDGEADDWIELQVPADVDLAGWMVILDGDDSGALWLDGVGAGFALITADGAPDQAELHAPFTLDQNGGVLFLLDADGALADEVRWPISRPDVSWARVSGEDWTYSHEPTPGELNDL
jgi:hypothetical protein